MKYSWKKGFLKFLVGAIIGLITLVVSNWDLIVHNLPENIQNILNMTIAGLILMGLNAIKQWLKSKNQ